MIGKVLELISRCWRRDDLASNSTPVRIGRARRTLLGLVAGASLLGGLSVVAAPAANAIGPSWTHNQYYGYSLLKNTPNVNAGYGLANLYNDTRVYMICWTDTAWVTDRRYSNYNSPRWFKVQTSWGQIGYVHSSYVYYQQGVGRC